MVACPRTLAALLTGASMAANDPTTRRAAAAKAARTRIAGMTDEQRRNMTAAARQALRQADLRAVDDEARQLDQYPLPAGLRAFRADLRAAVRAKAASDAARTARRQRREIEHLRAERLAEHAADHEARRGIGVDPSLAQMAARR